MDLLVNLDPLRDFFSGEPLEAATRRICARLEVDRPALRLLRRAASRNDARAALAYAWAAGAHTGSETLGNPTATTDLAAQAADLAPESASAQVCLGLAHAGSFGGRRATPLTARRAFGAAARLEPDNVVPHLLLAAARFGTNDQAGAERAITAALEATTCQPFLSPLAIPLGEAAPWLAWPLQQLWPERAEAALRYAADGLLRSQRTGDTLRLAALQATRGPQRGAHLLACLGWATRALRAALAANQPGAADALNRVVALTTRVVEEQRGLALRFEDAATGLVREAAAATIGGTTFGLVGLVRGRRRWPPPIIAALPGRTMAWLGLGTAAVAAVVSLVENGPARARRRVIERRLLAAETTMCTAASGELVAILGDYGVLVTPTPA